jgi:hypothetical protein
MKKLLILIVLIGVLSCKKKVTISGRVYNPITDQGIAGVKIDLRRDKYGLPGSVDGSGSKFIASTTTDEDGNYFFEERLSKNRPNRMSFNYDVDLFYNIETSQKILNTDEINQVIDFKLINTGKLAEDITNINCYDANDLLSIKYTQLNIQNYYENKYLNYKGCFFHDGNFNSVPMGWYKYEGTVTKNGLTTPIKDSIYVTAGGYHTWNIEY